MEVIAPITAIAKTVQVAQFMDSVQEIRVQLDGG